MPIPNKTPKKIRHFSKEKFNKTQMEVFSIAFMLQGLEIETFNDCLNFLIENGEKYTQGKFEKRKEYLEILKQLGENFAQLKNASKQFYSEAAKLYANEDERKQAFLNLQEDLSALK